ncbi:hypothetical protein GO013_04645 [Pseudodesulfovibrio sp. JC047]|uniref:hypothetical protein n=1 Tax=Pseudodesulfovibrio sp. JC047 TaxID=2683199 RepID=UPI0013D512AD|nr:hypothetical protein [Pseudodesulfovibrio sp. JC047]NDV18707.1 hypothetical protein [Pseudodesulfovibrio sp. JC047]
MQIERGLLLLAVVITACIGGILYRWQRPKLSVSYSVVAILAALFAVYYILNVAFGNGRTGWP